MMDELAGQAGTAGALRRMEAQEDEWVRRRWCVWVALGLLVVWGR
jgi:hypothetical protein